MRVSDNMINEMAHKSGLPINRLGTSESTNNALLEALDNKKIKDEYFGETSCDSKKMKTLTDAADKLSDIAEVFDTGESENKIFEAARQSGDMSEIADKVKTFAANFNSLLKNLSENNSGLFSLYYSELKSAASEYKNEFAAMGITFDKNGNMSVDEESLVQADIDELQGGMGLLSHKADFIASRVSDNAGATVGSISNRYDAYGNIFSQGTSRYDLFS